MMPPTTLLNPRISAICPFICGSSSSISSTTISCCNVFQHQCAYAFSQKRFSNFRRMAPSLLLSFQPHLNGIVNVDVDEEEELVLGDCLVFEEGIFDDPYVEESLNRSEEMNNSESIETGKVIDVKPENLVPDNWLEDQKEINITKKERRKLAFEEQFGRKVEKRKLEMRPIESSSGSRFVNYREEKLKQLKPIVLDSPAFRKGKASKEQGEEKMSESSTRVAPRNPKWAVYGGGLDDITKFFDSGTYDPNAKKSPEGTSKLLSKEEKLLLNRRIPDLAVATSGKWKPFHTLAASGEFYLATSLLKHNIDINLRDENGMTAIHKAILGKKQAIFNLLLRESANPFVCDKEGATLMHYAVRTASCQMIKILLLYNVDINRQDNDGWRPLHLAVQTRRTDIIRLLLIKGADKTLRNQDGLTPLDLSLHSGHDSRTYEIIKLLKYLPKTRAQ